MKGLRILLEARGDMGRFRMKLTNLIFILFLVAYGCDKKVARVGETVITNKDIRLRARVSEIYYPNSGQDYVALSQLIKGYLTEEVLKSLGYKIDSDVLEGEAKRIDTNTKAPDVLNAIKKVYGNDRESYLKGFVRIVYAERFLYNEVFLKSREIHKEEWEKIAHFLERAKKRPAEFSKIAKEFHLEPQRLRISKKEGIVIDAERDEAILEREPQGVEQAGYILSRISNTPAGEVYPEVIEWREGFQVLKVVKKGDEFKVESVSVPKKNYDEWFWNIARDVPVWIYDKELKDELIKNVPWAQKVNLL